jgi:ribosomal protein S6--L-glutamate ligase
MIILKNYKTQKQVPVCVLGFSQSRVVHNKRIMEAGEMRGHEMHFLNIKECYMRLDAETPEIHYRGGIILNQFDAIIPTNKT